MPFRHGAGCWIRESRLTMFSTNKVVGTLRFASIGIAGATIENQIDALEKAFIVYSCEQSRVRGEGGENCFGCSTAAQGFWSIRRQPCAAERGLPSVPLE